MSKKFSICQNMPNSGTLYVVSTPIGNLEDITIRALRVLKESDVILCEDTRMCLKLLAHFNIEKKRLVRYDEHVEEKRIPEVKEMLEQGLKVSLVSNAGTPTIQDPGYRLVRSLRMEGYKVLPVPGASALVAALSVSGCATDSFVFVGFLPRKVGKRKKLMESWIHEERTVIFYESPERILRTLQELKGFEKLGDRYIFIGREMTKTYEEYIFCKVRGVLENRILEKGEFVLVLEGSHE
ncbi:MAG TPA: 16S rRNA (cytidine(1402)-2'-O)-methyltransferase [Candidatus Hydrothermia bacterium]|nr:16S rRNA (cytidine(1402)-2'-O)-methyltransferase [Candidatus Hydrothermia bacterium]HOK22982.1 16S rRNA (cytidine(1402)-2'-O)-methyltransferase [Candidatus Hydrothermia bacterium]